MLQVTARPRAPSSSAPAAKYSTQLRRRGAKLQRRGGGQITDRNTDGGWRAGDDEGCEAPARASGAQGRGEGSTGWFWGRRAAAETAGGVTAGEGAEPGRKQPGQAD